MGKCQGPVVLDRGREDQLPAGGRKLGVVVHDVPSPISFCFRTKHLQVSIQKLRTQPKHPTAQMSLR